MNATTYAERKARFEEERVAAKARNLAVSARRKREAPSSGRLAVRHSSAPITWLPEPAYIGGIRVVGVAADAADDVRAMYL